MSRRAKPSPVLKRKAAADPQVADLKWADRLDIIDGLSLFLSELYVHLPLKRSLYGYDVLRVLESLKLQSTAMSNAEFHRELITSVNRLRDAHTQYQGPWTKKGVVASLPFLVEAFGPMEDTTYIVSKVDKSSVKDKYFVEGVLITHWNGVPFNRAVELHSEVETGGRPDSRRARALESLTFRALEYVPPPNEEWVTVAYVSLDKKQKSIRFGWKDLEPHFAPTSGVGSAATRFGQSINHAAEAVRRAKKLLFNKAKWLAEKKSPNLKEKGASLASDFADSVSARIVKTKIGDVGYLRIWSFSVDDDNAFIEAVTALLKALPERGLIIDIRNNPGGYIFAAERLLQLFTPNPVQPTKFALRATGLSAEMARDIFNQDELGPWSQSLDTAQSTGEPYSNHIPITPNDLCNNIGQRYGGPVVVVADANTYSSGDLFAAGIVDNGIAPLVCIGLATGAGGANVWDQKDLYAALRPLGHPLPKLPSRVGFTMAIRRAVRAGSSDGALIEDVGVAGQPYDMTGTDVLNGNQDLIEHCAKLLAAQPATRLTIKHADHRVQMTTAGIDRVNIYVDGHPTGPSIVLKKDGKHDQRLKAKRGQTVDVQAFSKGVLMQRRRFTVK